MDGLLVRIREELTARIAAAPTNGAETLELLMTAKYLEHTGNYAANTAEWVEFSIPGHHPQDS